MTFACPYCGEFYDDTLCSPCGENHNVEVDEDQLGWLESGGNISDANARSAKFYSWLAKQCPSEPE